MEDSNTLNSDDLLARLDRLLDWIKSCDTKASIVIAGTGLFLTLFTSEHLFNMLKTILTKTVDHIYFLNMFWLFFFIISLLIFTYGSYCLIKVLVPTLSKDLKKLVNRTDNDSLYYFEGISDNTYLGFVNKMKTRQKDADIQDILLQIYINSKICTLKYSYYNNGIKCVFTGMAGLLLFFIIGVILVKFGG